jgi:hypothetical protein
MKPPSRAREAFELADSSLANDPTNSSLLNRLAWELHLSVFTEYTDVAVAWARQALDLSPGTAEIQHTLASIQISAKRPEEAMIPIRFLLADAKWCAGNIKGVSELLMKLAANGNVREAIQILEKSQSSGVLEPLLSGLRLYAGEVVSSATEITEIAKDVAKEIEELRKRP